MARVSPDNFVIGHADWAERVRRFTADITPSYWDDFRPVSGPELAQLESDLNRSLPADFRAFLGEFGSGGFPRDFGGDIYSPDDMRLACHGPLLMQLGSSTWASDDAQRRFYVSRGRDNPSPERFTPAAMNKLGFSLLDLLQVGTDGCCGYHQIHVGDGPKPFGYCLLHGTQVLDRMPSFSDALREILTRHWRWRHGVDEEGGRPAGR